MLFCYISTVLVRVFLPSEHFNLFLTNLEKIHVCEFIYHDYSVAQSA